MAAATPDGHPVDGQQAQVRPVQQQEAGIHEVSAAQYRQQAVVLGNAFAADPVMMYIFPDAANRPQRIAGIMHLALKTYGSQGLVQTVDGGRCCAVWQCPSPSKPSLIDLVVNAIEGLFKLRSCVERASNVQAAMSAAHITQPHWYLAILGTEPDCRGPWQGGESLASRLMNSVLQTCDEQQLPAYLESSNWNNITFYKKHGFKITQELTLPQGPSLWGMIRE